jgi:UDP-N-acetylmuramate: L-alanyl-gamma-D-glutamyl-meso-diaminopimelate ligase
MTPHSLSRKPNLKIYILGICGTFMAGVALLAREKGFEVEGSDAGVYPPMSTQLSDAGITLHDGYDAGTLPDDGTVFIVGNAISRGNPQFETILEHNLPYTSGPQWLYEQVLRDRWVLAVAGTHGKTTTSSMLAWILQFSGLNPGYLIGGVSQNFSQSASLGESPFFVIEADEYDTALFDKRSKFVHYHPRTLILNNLEFDHADIFDDLPAIQRQFHHLVRTLPKTGLIIHNRDIEALDEVLAMGCWSDCLSFALDNVDSANMNSTDNTADFSLDDQSVMRDQSTGQSYPIQLAQTGQFNALNACAAALAARHVGVPLKTSIEALNQFGGVKRRQEVIAEINGIRIIDDFAHHPTAIALTLEALKAQTKGRLFAVIEMRSNTMKMGSLRDKVALSLGAADVVLMVDNPSLEWDINDMAQFVNFTADIQVLIKSNTGQIIDQLVKDCQPTDQIVIMSNGGFDNIHQRLILAMQSKL